TRSTSSNCAVSGILNALGDLQPNAGTFRRINVLLREDCMVGVPRHPVSCSMATTTVACRLTNLIQHAMSQFDAREGMAEGGAAIGPASSVIVGAAGRDTAPFIGHLICARNGG